MSCDRVFRSAVGAVPFRSVASSPVTGTNAKEAFDAVGAVRRCRSLHGSCHGKSGTGLSFSIMNALPALTPTTRPPDPHDAQVIRSACASAQSLCGLHLQIGPYSQCIKINSGTQGYVLCAAIDFYALAMGGSRCGAAIVLARSAHRVGAMIFCQYKRGERARPRRLWRCA